MNEHKVSENHNHNPCLAMYEMNVLDPLGRPILRDQMCGARISVFFREYFLAVFEKVELRKPITELSICGAHATDFCHAQRALMKKHDYFHNIANRPFCEMLKNPYFSRKKKEE